MDPDAPDGPPLRRQVPRRAFVKGCVYASAALLAGAGAQAVVGPLGGPAGGAWRRVDYLGATVLSGPAPQGLPLLPLALDAAGEVRGNPSPEGLDGTVLDWYRYCGHGRARGLQPGWEGDERLRYHVTPEKQDALAELRALAPDTRAGWFLPRLGEPVRAADFPRVGDGAPALWRSPGGRGADLVTAVVLKVDPGALRFDPGVREGLVRAMLAPTPDGAALLGYVSFCKHLCCVPGWHESKRALQQGAFDTLFCTCHDSVYDPLRIRGDFFMLHDEAPA